jgi:BASS family bile acid:Na+ symporter
MDGIAGGFHRLGSWIQRWFLGLLLAVYALAAVCPGLGLAARKVSIARLAWWDENVELSLPMLLLGVLLFNAGLTADAAELVHVARKPRTLLAGLLASWLVPVGFLFVLLQGLRFWHNPDETSNLLVGLAIVAAMPVAGSSTAWSQNANGSMALSLGLVVLSTLLSPLTTPLTLRTLGTLASGKYAEALGQLGGHHTGAFLLLCVLLPSLAGLGIRHLLGRPRLDRLKPRLHLGNSAIVLFLCHVNATLSLPLLVAEPDWDFLAVVLGVVLALCLAAFAAGGLLGRFLGVDEAQRRSLLFGLGMNNNGTGMVLAATSLAPLPRAILPVLAYNLVQHLVAGGVHGYLRSTRPIVCNNAVGPRSAPEISPP